MRKSKRKKLEAAGWRVGSAGKLLGLSEEESAYVELKLALSNSLRQNRQRKRLTQVQLAELVSSSQSRIAKMEAGDPTVSIDLLIRSLLALGVSREEIGNAMARE